MTAGAVFSVSLEEVPQAMSFRVLRGAARIAGALVDQGRDPGFGDVSPVFYRVVVKELATDRVVLDRNWRGDEQGAREAFRSIESDLATLDEMTFHTACASS